MGPIVLLVSFFLLHLCEAEVTPVFVQTGKDLPLNVKEAVTLGEADLLTWTVNNKKDIARLGDTGRVTIFRDYSGRAELQNQSLLLMTVTKSDSGDYRARVSGDDPKVLAEYKVTVLDPVSPVKLTVNTCSSDSSNLTVTCSTQDSLISRTFTCDNQTCSDERGERAEFTTPGASLNVYLQNNSIICVHKNKVSRTEDVIKIEDLCKKSDDFKPPNTPFAAILVPIFFFTAFIFAVFLYLKKKSKNENESAENTIYDVPQDVNKDQPPVKRPTDDAASTSPSTVYYTLGQINNTEESTEAVCNTLPESLYDVVEKPAKS
ncbi:uncharacterized protein LOC117827362 isoform X1 [Notolabrus celidotus]|uniref:uncharacterized protein LOC117827362 isoform X1 n=1 Tax=Notolabrus celidotus TaxID=1203425 RepID=UPI00148F9A18|nr:uncharacterized protein LOC117827362 isoform X1 [Notolabrus celidotus]